MIKAAVPSKKSTDTKITTSSKDPKASSSGKNMSNTAKNLYSMYKNGENDHHIDEDQIKESTAQKQANQYVK